MEKGEISYDIWKYFVCYYVICSQFKLRPHRTSSLTTTSTRHDSRLLVRQEYFTDVDDVSFAVNHNVAIVSVFELQQERQQAVASHANNEVPPSLPTSQQVLYKFATKEQQQ